MASLNKITLIGNLGADPDLRYQPDGKAVTNVRIATNRSWPDGKGGWNEESIWFNGSLWESAAERAAENLRKGDQVYVEGRLKPPRMFTRRDGSPGASLDVNIFTIFKLGKKESAEYDDDSQLPPGESRPQPEMDVDDIPF